MKRCKAGLSPPPLEKSANGRCNQDGIGCRTSHRDGFEIEISHCPITHPHCVSKSWFITCIATDRASRDDPHQDCFDATVSLKKLRTKQGALRKVYLFAGWSSAFPKAMQRATFASTPRQTGFRCGKGNIQITTEAAGVPMSTDSNNPGVVDTITEKLSDAGAAVAEKASEVVAGAKKAVAKAKKAVVKKAVSAKKAVVKAAGKAKAAATSAVKKAAPKKAAKKAAPKKAAKKAAPKKAAKPAAKKPAAKKAAKKAAPKKVAKKAAPKKAAKKAAPKKVAKKAAPKKAAKKVAKKKK
jgi:hypothetical protein